MTPQELKNSILQLAIQGKLVEQRPEERTAEELYRQIQEEKRRLIKEGKIKANKKIEPISDDIIPFDIPGSWIWIRFGNLVNYSMGKTPPRAEPEWWGRDIPWVSIADMPESGHICETKECVTSAAIVKKFGNKFSPAGTLLMSFKLTVGRVSILDIDAVHNEAIISIYPLVDDVDVEKMYLFYVLPFVSQFGESKNAIKGKTLNDTSICNLLLPLPPLAEQKRIVAKIEELLPYIDRYEQAWKRLEDFNKRFPVDMQKSLLQWAIQGKLVEQRPEEGTAEELYRQIQEEKRRLVKEGKIKKEKPLPEITEDEVPFEIPGSWKWARLGQITHFQGGYAYKSSSYVPKSTNQIIRLGNVKPGCLLPEVKPAYITDEIATETECYRIQENDILVTMTGTRRKKDYFYAAKICKNDIINHNLFLNQRVGCFRIVDGLLPEYLLKVMQCEVIRELIFKKETGTANQGNLGSEDMKMYVYVPLPPLAEQKRIVAKLEELLPLCERLK